MHWLGLVLGSLCFTLIELGLLVFDAIACVVGRRAPGAPANVDATTVPRASSGPPPASADVAGRLATVLQWRAARGTVEVDGLAYPAFAFHGKPRPGDSVRVIRAGRHSLLVESLH
jgi:hypothetical protein